MMSQSATVNTVELGQLGSGEWEQRLEQLARDADDAGPDASLQARLDLAMAAFSMLWLGWSPPLIARSARASMALREPVLIAPADLLDKALLSSRAARREGLKYLEHLPVPGTALAPVMLDDDDDDRTPVAPARPPRRQRLSAAAAAPVPPGWLTCEQLAEAKGLSCSAVQRWVREGSIPSDQIVRSGGRYWLDPAVENPDRKAHTPRPAPDGWMLGAEVCSLLGINRAKLSRWRREGVIPPAACQPHGRGFVFDGDLVEALKHRQQGAAPDGWTD
jgi:hypothetical protein